MSIGVNTLFFFGGGNKGVDRGQHTFFIDGGGPKLQHVETRQQFEVRQDLTDQR